MNQRFLPGRVSRRHFLTGAAGVTGAGLIGARLSATPPVQPLRATDLRSAAATVHPQKQVHLMGTDGWVSMPEAAPADPPFFPDSLAPAPFNTYVFGFRDVTGLSATQAAAQRGV